MNENSILDRYYKSLFVRDLFNAGQIHIDTKGFEWKNNERYTFRFDGGRTIERYPDLLKTCARELKEVIDDIAPDATHVCSIPRAAEPLAEELSNIYGLECISYDKSWHGVSDFVRYLKSKGKDVDSELQEFMPHGSYGKLKGNIEEGAKIIIVDNVISSTAASKIEAKEILGKLLKNYYGFELGKDVEIAGFAVLQNNSPYAYDVLSGDKLGAVLTAPETFAILRQDGYLNDSQIYRAILNDLFRLGWFSDAATPERVGNKNLYNFLRKDFEKFNLS